jgi:redox-sensitive bicupin YhaK (pirin superfamily)
MPAITPSDVLVLPRIVRPDPALSRQRLPVRVVEGLATFEGEGFPVRRPFPGRLSLQQTDPFLLLDHMGAVEYGPGEPKGTAWHPHRGFETVTYIIDGAFAHRDSTGGGGLIADGSTQWMTAGDGILHIETPPEWLVQSGGLFHGVQLWVNLPREIKRVPPRYQDIQAPNLALLASADGGALVRLIAGSLAGHDGPGHTYTPITYAHATIQPGAGLQLPWRSDFNAMVYVLSGSGTAGPAELAAPIREGQLAVLGGGDAVTVSAATTQESRSPALDVLLLGGRPINEPIVNYGPFVMNTKEEIIEAIEDFNAGRMGQIPASAR